MRLDITTKEKERAQKLALPAGTIIFERGPRDPVASYKVTKNNKWQLLRDYVEEKRDWLPGEKELFVTGKTRDDVIKFFTTPEADDIPQREFSTLYNLEWELQRYIHHAGHYRFYGEERDDPKYPVFGLSIRDNNFTAIEEEILWAQPYLEKAYGDRAPELLIYCRNAPCCEMGTEFDNRHYLNLHTLEVSCMNYEESNTAKKYASLQEAIVAIHRLYPYV